MTIECNACMAAGIGFGVVIGGAIVSAFFVIDRAWRFITDEKPDDDEIVLPSPLGRNRP
jgi:hypothetical protein